MHFCKVFMEALMQSVSHDRHADEEGGGNIAQLRLRLCPHFTPALQLTVAD